MLKQEGVGLRNTADDKDTLSINDSSPLSNILQKYCCNDWDKLTQGKGGTWDIGTTNYLFQDTYKLNDFDLQNFSLNGNSEMSYHMSSHLPQNMYKIHPNVHF